MAVWSLTPLVFLASLAGLSVLGCGAKRTSSPPLLASDMSTEVSLAAPPIENVKAPITQLERQDVVDTIDAGLGRFLQDFETEASLTESGKFRGFRIVRVFDREKYEGLGIGVGDIITAVNGKPIERPDQAFEVFLSLKTAPSLDIDYLRGDRQMRLSLPIVGQANSSPAEASSKKAPGAPTKSTSNESRPEAAASETSSIAKPASPEEKKSAADDVKAPKK